MFRCPGQDQRYWKPEDIFEIDCPGCGRTIEFFKDEPKLKCRGCGQMVSNSKIDLGCAEWCKYADQCLGVSVRKEAMILQDKLIEKMKGVFGSDSKRINHALSVLDYAEQIQAGESGDPLVVKAAAILHDIGIIEAERKHGSSAGKYQEIEGPPIAREILSGFGVDEALVEHICKIIGSHHSGKDIDTLEFRIVFDADWVVNIGADYGDKSDVELEKIIDDVFKTTKGREIAIERFLKNRKLKI